jgi:hypothetical protein
MGEIATPLSVARKVILKASCPVLYALHCHFNNAFLQREMDMVIWFKEPTSLRLPSSTIR